MSVWKGALVPGRIPRFKGIVMDTLTKAERSRQMSLIRSRDTKPEMIVRRLVHGLGYRFRLHRRELPGCPDLVFTSRGSVIFVHGCFWHRHTNCRNSRLPKTRLDFWKTKLERNKQRDTRTKYRLTRLGWRYLVIWECETTNLDRLTHRISTFLEQPT